MEWLVVAEVIQVGDAIAVEENLPTGFMLLMALRIVGVHFRMRERRLTPPSSATAEGRHDCCVVGSAGSGRHDGPEQFAAALG
jgi:hypothetical protein